MADDAEIKRVVRQQKIKRELSQAPAPMGRPPGQRERTKIAFAGFDERETPFKKFDWNRK
jgi:hypothetical protein